MTLPRVRPHTTRRSWYSLKLRNSDNSSYELPNKFSGPSGQTVRITAFTILVLLAARFLSITFPRQRFLYSAFFTGFQIIGMSLDFLNNIFLLDLPFEPAQSVFKRLSLLQPNFGQV